MFIVPRNVLGGPGFIAPSDQLNIASIGTGGKGYDITHDWASKERVIALCDVHPDKNDVVNARKKYPNAFIFKPTKSINFEDRKLNKDEEN